MGHHAGSLHDLLPTPHRHQVPSIGRLPCRLGRDPVPTAGSRLHSFADALRWIQDAHGLGAGIVLTSPKGDKLTYALQIHFAASNNVAEYEALIHGIRLAKELGIRRILCYGDSDLVVQQSSGDWDAKDANMASYRFLVQQISGYFEGCEFLHVPRADNEQADALARIGSTRQAIPTGVSL